MFTSLKQIAVVEIATKILNFYKNNWAFAFLINIVIVGLRNIQQFSDS